MKEGELGRKLVMNPQSSFGNTSRNERETKVRSPFRLEFSYPDLERAQ